MPLYDYECEGCKYTLEDIKQSFKDEPLRECPNCGDEKLFRVVTGGIHASIKGSDTIGKIADRNSNLNKNKIQESNHQIKESQPTEKKPWYHKNATASNQEINSMTNKQKAKYIMEGKK